jgi:cell pole-organizing protein PopZ
MSETNAQEPTMEEILASIRRIISEDEPPAEEAAAPAAKAAAPASVRVAEPPKVEPARPPVAETKTSEAAPAATPHTQEEDVLELTDPVQPEPATTDKTYEETLGDLDVFSASAAQDAADYAQSAPASSAEPLIGSYTSETTALHFGSLARSVSMPKDGRSLEDIVRDLLNPMLRDWLDRHLAAIVEARVQAEVERISRRNY